MGPMGPMGRMGTDGTNESKRRIEIHQSSKLTVSDAAIVQRDENAAIEMVSLTNWMCPSVNRQYAPPVCRLNGSLSFFLFMTSVQLPAGPQPSVVPSAVAPSKLNGPSLSAQPIP